MLLEDTKQTTGSQWSYFVIEDINQRAEAAMDQHPEVFEDDTHQVAVETIEQLAKNYFAGYNAIYSTARPATKKRPAHTEVKVSRYILRKSRDSNGFKKLLEAAGAKQIVWKPKTESVSFHVWV